jgi:hypothetical protein
VLASANVSRWSFPSKNVFLESALIAVNYDRLDFLSLETLRIPFEMLRKVASTVLDNVPMLIVDGVDIPDVFRVELSADGVTISSEADSRLRAADSIVSDFVF